MYFWSGIFWFRSKDGPGHQARSGPWRVELYGRVWRHPRPGGVLWGPLESGAVGTRNIQKQWMRPGEKVGYTMIYLYN